MLPVYIRYTNVQKKAWKDPHHLGRDVGLDVRVVTKKMNLLFSFFPRLNATWLLPTNQPSRGPLPASSLLAEPTSFTKSTEASHHSQPLSQLELSRPTWPARSLQGLLGKKKPHKGYSRRECPLWPCLWWLELQQPSCNMRAEAKAICKEAGIHGGPGLS